MGDRAIGRIECRRGAVEGGNEPVEVSHHAVCTRATDKAILVVCDELGCVWVPKSVIHDDSECYADQTVGTLVVQKWFAQKEQWI